MIALHTYICVLDCLIIFLNIWNIVSYDVTSFPKQKTLFLVFFIE